MGPHSGLKRSEVLFCFGCRQVRLAVRLDYIIMHGGSLYVCRFESNRTMPYSGKPERE
jgi:hypothetical protein